MAQKYKFFIKENVVTFSQGADFGVDNDSLTTEWINSLKHMDLNQDSVVVLNDLDRFYKSLLDEVLHIRAGGGFVVNSDDQLLMIHRRGHWDLPKGKQELGESIEATAIREVEEECGVRDLCISSEPFSTFHFYEEDGETVLKESVWYKMTTDFKGQLSPQAEEGIKQAKWVDLPVSAHLIKASYGSIKDVILHFS